ncbi:MAG TPA: hypothetical protein PKJ33_01805 [Alphaproteobacteria bacterium]|nr:hypothetical protein [Alphaproteobacteria bacterium]
MKKVAIFTLLSVLSAGSFAATTSSSNSEMGGPGSGMGGPGSGMGPGGNPFADLTDTQKSCVKECGITIPDESEKGTPPAKDEKRTPPAQGEMKTPPSGEKPSEGGPNKMTDTQKSCIKACGVEMPEPLTDGKADQRSIS